MKKTALILSLLLCTGALFSCGQNETSEVTETSEAALSSAAIDYDLTTMSSTMVYSTVSNMMLYPDVYEGKMVRITGNFNVYHDTAGGRDIFAAIVPDATACCEQGIEFVLQGEHTYPDDYPEEGQSITIQGLFNTYNEYGFNYVQLKDAEMTVNS